MVINLLPDWLRFGNPFIHAWKGRITWAEALEWDERQEKERKKQELRRMVVSTGQYRCSVRPRQPTRPPTGPLPKPPPAAT